MSHSRIVDRVFQKIKVAAIVAESRPESRKTSGAFS
nr:MAG TPA: hypothetical protein [Bacteriophage sp.]